MTAIYKEIVPNIVTIETAFCKFAYFQSSMPMTERLTLVLLKYTPHLPEENHQLKITAQYLQKHKLHHSDSFQGANDVEIANLLRVKSLSQKEQEKSLCLWKSLK